MNLLKKIRKLEPELGFKSMVDPTKDLLLKGVYPIMFASNVFHNSNLIQKCIQKLLIFYTFLNKMRVVKNIRRKDDRMNSL